MTAPERDIPGSEANSASREAAATTPLMAQYLAIKSEHGDALLFYRMGDFYELFFEDAAKAARALDIALTKRGKHEGEDIPMCGVPVHAADAYLSRLIRQGFKVAVCEQVEDPAEARKRGSKAVVRREVIRLVTPGTLSEDTLLDARRHNYLVALARIGTGHEARIGMAWADMSTGDVRATDVARADCGAELARISPGEIVHPDSLLAEEDWRNLLDDLGATLTPLPASRFDSVAGERRVRAAYGVATLEGFGNFGRAECAALGALIDYLDLTQKGKLPSLRPPVREESRAIMLIDAATRRSLEITATLNGAREGSLLAAIDRTLTGAGARLLAERLSAPLTDPAAINARLDAQGHFITARDDAERLRAALNGLPDLARALSRLSLERGGPRDLAAVRDALDRAAAIRSALENRSGLPPELARIISALGHHGALTGLLREALAPELPLLARDGGFIATGHRADLDEFRTLRDESRRHIAALQQRYADETGVAALKIRHNNILGYYIEVGPKNADRLADPARFIHRQTMANAVRFTSVELGDLEKRISEAAERALAIELGLFEDLRQAVLARAGDISATATALAELDLAAAIADIAVARNWCRPKVHSGTGFVIRAGRHPVVEEALARRNDAAFIANDCDLSNATRLWLLTGPNMAGKSTFLRQNALIAVLAQAGCHVPAAAAEIGAIDRLFSRVGAADDLARGRSTFMVEMVEAAAILNQAGERSLVILDEIGRGTATFDGLSIAWAVVEHLHDINRCRALFATHFHELTALANKLPSLANRTMKVKEWQGDVVFLHEVGPGAADRSYGIQVAKLAGLPDAVIARAETVLATLEKSGQTGSAAKLIDDLPLFSLAPVPKVATAPKASEVEDMLRAVRPDELSPRDALDLLYRLRDKL